MHYSISLARLAIAGAVLVATVAPAHAELTFTSAQISLATNAQTPVGIPDNEPHPSSSSIATMTPTNLTLVESSSVINGNPISSFATSIIDSQATFLNGGLTGLFAANTQMAVLDLSLFASASANFEFVYRFNLDTISGFEGFYSLTPTTSRTASSLALTGPSGFSGIMGSTGSQYLSLLPGAYELRFASAFFLSRAVDSSTAADAYSFRISPSTAPAVPEPGTWAMMILGFGMVGGALRAAHRQRPALKCV